MNIKQNLEANIISAHTPNFVVLEDVMGNLKLSWTLTMNTSVSGEFFYSANNGEVEVNLLEITKLIYNNIENYTDSFDYTASVLYTENDKYHYGKLDLTFEDAIDTINIVDTAIVNSALQVKECNILPQYLDTEIGDPDVVIDGILLNFDLNEDIV